MQDLEGANQIAIGSKLISEKACAVFPALTVVQQILGVSEKVG